MPNHFNVRHLQVPATLFRDIERLTGSNPARLSMHHWHEKPDGSEARLPVDIFGQECKHCLFGWVVFLVPGAVQWAWDTYPDMDPVELGNALLVSSGRYPIPPALAFADEVSAMKIIRGRAAEERELAECEAEEAQELAS